MAIYASDEDCRLIYADWGSLSGTDGTAIRTEASAMVDAYLGDFSMSPPLPTSGTVYDYYVRKAASNLAVWLAADACYRPQYEVGAPAWWDTYMDRAQDIFTGLREGKHTFGSSPNTYERGIGPAIPRANGTIAAAPWGMCMSNHEVVGAYYTDDEFPRRFLVQLDGTGTAAFTQTYKWQYLGGTAWERETQTCTPDMWQPLAFGVQICFPVGVTGTLATGQQWLVECNPSRQRNYKGFGLKVWSLKRG